MSIAAGLHVKRFIIIIKKELCMQLFVYHVSVCCVSLYC